MLLVHVSLCLFFSYKDTRYNGFRQRWQTQGPQAESGPPPCFIWPGTLFLPGSSSSSMPLVKAWLHLYSPKITFGPLKATARLMWPPVKMSLTPLAYCIFLQHNYSTAIKIRKLTLIYYCCSVFRPRSSFAA